eukprot:117414-Lingulodinium_polyedra.AAC.1
MNETCMIDTCMRADDCQQYEWQLSFLRVPTANHGEPFGDGVCGPRLRVALWSSCWSSWPALVLGAVWGPSQWPLLLGGLGSCD